MKKYLLLIFALASSSVLNAQLLQSVGVKSGLALANQSWLLKSGDKLFDTYWRNGFYGALSLEFSKSKHWSLVTDLGYYSKGHVQEVLNSSVILPEGDGTFATFDTRFSYLVLNPMLKWRHETKHFTPYALLGMRIDRQLAYASDINWVPLEKDMRKTLWGATAGAGVELKRNQMGLLLEAQYQHDFTKLINLPVSATSGGMEIKNRAFVVCAGLKYYLP